MEAAAIQDHRYDIFTSSLNNLEFSDDLSRAILTIPLMHVGANKKGLYWTAEMLKKVAPMFRAIPFRYDLEGKEGSSHTINKLSSPHFDVGWTHNSDDGAWYDSKTKIMWVKGEVTHPDVIQKLKRQTTDGQREVNYASMGVIVEEAKCSICGGDFDGNECENNHVRTQKYKGKKCYKVPTEVSKALHAALTNDPADGEADIKDVIFQEMGQEDKKMENENKQDNSDNYNASPFENKDQAGQQQDKSQLNNQIPGGLAPSSPQTAQPGSAPSSEEILKNLAERIKTIEQKVSAQSVQEGSPELINAAPQDQFVQSNMGVTSQFEAQKPMEENNMAGEMKSDPKLGQASNAKTDVNPDKKEYQEGMNMGDPMQQIMGMLQQILQRVGGAEMQDMGKESLDASKGMAKPAQSDVPMEHMGPGDAVGDSKDAGNVKNKENMMKPGSVATADDSAEAEPEKEPEAEAEGEKEEEVKEESEEEAKEEGLEKEVADLKASQAKMMKHLELQDNNIPEFGGSNNNTKKLDVADMGATGRTEKFGEYGAWDSIFNGSDSAQKFADRRGI